MGSAGILDGGIFHCLTDTIQYSIALCMPEQVQDHGLRHVLLLSQYICCQVRVSIWVVLLPSLLVAIPVILALFVSNRSNLCRSFSSPKVLSFYYFLTDSFPLSTPLQPPLGDPAVWLGLRRYSSSFYANIGSCSAIRIQLLLLP